ncbi:MAG: alpha/beta hydrolase [Chitinophagales bacterium]
MKKIIAVLFCMYCFAGKAQTIDTFIDVSSHKLHFHIIKGNNSPILFESGNGDDASVWNPLLDQIHTSTGATLITYDRAGLGKSGIDTLHISFKNEIKDLEKALKKLGYAKNLFFVSHSFGGFYSSLYTYRNKKKVKGAVFIDVATPCFFTTDWAKNFTDSIKTEDWNMIKQYKLGLYYVLSNFKNISAYMNDKYLSSATPATLIIAENILPLVKKEEQAKWTDCLRAFGTMPNHQYVVAKDAEHKVWEKQPQLVIDEIVKLYKQVSVK